jgi:DNA polymerase
MGVRVWQPGAELAPTAVATPVAAPVAAPVSISASVSRLGSASVTAHAVAIAVPLAAAKPSADAVASLGKLPEGLSLMDWAALKTAAGECRACGLCEQRQASVFADGLPAAEQATDWLIVGDAPNDSENASGKPFSGPEADLLDAMLLAMGLHRPTGSDAKASVVLVNALKCKPPAQRNPHADELAQCRHFLNRQIELLQPRVILALGRLASMAVLHDSLPDVHALPLGKLRGKVHHAYGRPVIVSYHPAYLMRTPSDKAKAWSDLVLAMQQLKRIDT